MKPSKPIKWSKFGNKKKKFTLLMKNNPSMQYDLLKSLDGESRQLAELSGTPLEPFTIGLAMLLVLYNRWTDFALIVECCRIWIIEKCRKDSQ